MGSGEDKAARLATVLVDPWSDDHAAVEADARAFHEDTIHGCRLRGGSTCWHKTSELDHALIRERE